MHEQAVGALRHHPPRGVLDQVELARIVRKSAGTPRHLDDAEPAVSRSQRGDAAGTAQPDRAGVVADQCAPAIRGQAGGRTEHDRPAVQPAERLAAGCPDVIVLDLDEVEAGIERRSVRVVRRRRVLEQGPHRQGRNASRMRLRPDAQQAMIADDQQVGAEQRGAMPVLVVGTRVEGRREGGTGAKPIHPVGEHRPDMAVRGRTHDLDLAVLGQPLGRTEPSEAQPVIAVEAVLGACIQEPLAILRQRSDGAVGQAGVLAERAKGEALRRRRAHRAHHEDGGQQDRPDDQGMTGGGGAGERGGPVAHAGHQT